MEARTPTRRMTRDEARQRTVERLLEAAEAAFRERGYAGVSVDEIAEAAGYSKGAVYANFAGKEGLFLAVVTRRDRSKNDELLAAIDGAATAQEMIERVGAWYAERRRGSVEQFLLDGEFWLMSSRNPNLRQLAEAGYALARASIAQLVERNTERLGLAPQLPLDELAAAIIALTNGIESQSWFEVDAVGDEVFPDTLAVLLGVPRPTADPA